MKSTTKGPDITIDKYGKRLFMNRRILLKLGLASLVLPTQPIVAKEGITEFPFKLSKSEWKARLTPLEFDVMREEATERAFTSPLNDNYKNGTYHCKGCSQELYLSLHKFDSGTGWPSFSKEIDGAVGTRKDRKFFMIRTECHCSNCGSHLGHIFDDGPQPTGKRHCINGVSLVFYKA